MIHVPYKGAAPAEQDLLAGQVDIFMAPFGKKYLELHKTGKLKVLAMLNPTRLDSVKDLPAIGESKALKDFNFNIWTGYFVKKDTPTARRSSAQSPSPSIFNLNKPHGLDACSTPRQGRALHRTASGSSNAARVRARWVCGPTWMRCPSLRTPVCPMPVAMPV